MRSWVRSMVLVAAVAAGAGPAFAAEPSVSAERARIAREKAAVQAEASRREAECRQRFVVTSCVDDARRAEREALTRLKHQEVILDDQVRQQRAIERNKQIQEAESARRREEAATGTTGAAEARRQQRERKAEARATHPAKPPERKAVDEQANLAKNARTQAEIDARKREVEERNARRAASGKKPAAPLPVPP